MKLQMSSTTSRECAKCKRVMPRSFKRYNDNGLHYHPECKPRVKKVEFSFIGWLLSRLK